MTAFIFILLLSLLVVIHELGHFFVARKAGVKVSEFGFGYPPKLLRLFYWKGTRFTLNLIPFGGFVKLEGEEYDPAYSDEPPAGAFYTKSALARIGVVVAGPLANILFGIVAFSVIFGVMGVPQSLEGRPRIDVVAVGSPAQQAGIEPNREIIGFREADEVVATPQVEDVVRYAAGHQGETVMLILTGECQQAACQESVAQREVYIRSSAETPPGEGGMGIVFADYYLEKGPWYTQIPRGIVYGTQQAFLLGMIIVQALGQLVSDLVQGGKVPADLAGPVGIVHQATENRLLSRGFITLLEFSGMLSINLGIMNLLPIPALDGGRILFVLLEKIVGKRRIQGIEGYAHYGGFILLLGLIIFISIRDVAALF